MQTHERVRARSLRRWFSVAAPLSVSLLPALVFAQQGNGETQLQKVIVTGSNIPRTTEEQASPVQVVTRAQIEASGKQTVADVLQSLSGNGQGSIPAAFSGGFAAGATGISLRGLGVNSTLVLLNGRRLAPYGLADDGQRSFVDLNTIPLEAVDRVEVLKDGASAIYGSDAIGGVVNIITRSSYQGGSLGFDYSTSYKFDGDNRHWFGSGGFGNYKKDGYNVFLTFDGSVQDAIAQGDRDSYLGTQDLRPYGFFDNRQGSYSAGRGEFADGSGPAFSSVTPYGTVRVPGGNASQRINLSDCPSINPQTGVCTYSTLGYDQITPKQSRVDLFSRGTFRLNDSAQAYLEAGYFFSGTDSTGTPSGVNDSGVFNPNDPGNPVVHTTTLPAGHPDNPTGVNRTLSLLTTSLGGRNGTQKNEVLRFVSGVKGDFLGFNYDVGAEYAQTKLDQKRTGYILYPELQSALNAGTFRIDPRLTPKSVLDTISPELKNVARTSLTSVDATASRELFSYGQSSVSLAFGAEYRNEKTNSPPVPNTDTADVVGLGYASAVANRDVTSVHAELDGLLSKYVELDAAARYDHYSDAGDSTTPKVGIKITPIEQVSLRGSYSEAFRAPGPSENGNSSTFGFTNIGILTIGNPDLKPETAKIYQFGLVLEPVRAASLSVDYYRVVRKDEIAGGDQGSILAGIPITGEPNSSIPGAIPNSQVFYDVDGNIGTISSPYQNLNETSTSGLDWDARYKLNLHRFGALTAQLNWTHLLKFRRTLPDGTTYEYVGTHGPYALSSAGGTPRDRGNFSLTWERKAWLASTTVNYISGFELIDHQGESLVDNGDGTYSTTTFEGAYFNVDPKGKVCGVYNPDGSPTSDCRVQPFTTVDIFGKYSGIKHWEFSASIANLLDRRAPFDPYTYGGVNYDPAFHQAGAIGRYITLGARYTF